MKNSVKRLNITLPTATVELLETVANKGERSSYIDNAIKSYAKQNKQNSLREGLKEGAIARRERDLDLADEWFEIDDKLWQK